MEFELLKFHFSLCLGAFHFVFHYLTLMELFVFKRIILDLAKSLTFPLPLLAVAHQQLLLGTESLNTIGSLVIALCLEMISFVLNTFSYIAFFRVFTL